MTAMILMNVRVVVPSKEMTDALLYGAKTEFHNAIPFSNSFKGAESARE